MNFQDICIAVKEIGLPAAILFWILIVNGRQQRDMVNTMQGIQKELTNLTVVIHDVIYFMRSKGG
jgi:hypothetical protein